MSVTMALSHVLPSLTRTSSPMVKGFCGLIPRSYYRFCFSCLCFRRIDADCGTLGSKRLDLVASMSFRRLHIRSWAGEYEILLRGVLRYSRRASCGSLPSSIVFLNNIPDVPIWDSEPVTVDFALSEFDKSSTSTVFKSRFNEVRQRYLDFCHIYTDGSKVETKVASAYVCPYGTRGYRLRDGCGIFTAEVEAINKALTYVKVSARKSFVIFSDSMSVLQAIESQESKNPLVNRVLQTCQEILSNDKFIIFCWIPSHRDITRNEDADRAAKDALSKAQPTNFELPCTYVFLKIQPFVSSLW